MSLENHEIFHTSQVNKIKKIPLIIGLEDIVISTGESIIFKSNGSSIHREPDGMMFDPSTHILYNIEYKTNDTDTAYQKAKLQLRTSGEKLQEIFRDWKVRNLYVSGNFEVREL